MGDPESFRDSAERVLEPAVMSDLATVSDLVARSGARMLLVGGMVRDVLLGRPTRDIDLVVFDPAGPGRGGAPERTGDLVSGLAAELASALRGKAHPPSELLTCRIELAGGRRLDLAMARRETYSAPAALPSVMPGDLASDLARRDYTINAMAVELGEPWGKVLDPHRGREDLEAGLLRLLHPGSFLDDPTRTLRGVELAVRLGFEIEPRAMKLAREALAEGVLDRLSPARWRTAWSRAFVPLLEAGPEALTAGLRLTSGIGLLRALHPRLRLDAPGEARARRLAARSAGTTPRTARPAQLLARCLAWEDGEVAASLAARWGLPAAAEREWESFPDRLRRARRELAAGEPIALSRLDAALARFSTEELCLLELSSELAPPVERYRRRAAGFRLTIGGDDLKAHGYRPGKGFGAALERTRHARLDGSIGPDEELEYACRLLEAMER